MYQLMTLVCHALSAVPADGLSKDLLEVPSRQSPGTYGIVPSFDGRFKASVRIHFSGHPDDPEAWWYGELADEV